MKILEVEQGSSEWLSFREGKRTGTSIGKLFAKSRKTGELYDTEKPLVTLYQKVAERLAEGTGDDDGLELVGIALQHAAQLVVLGAMHQMGGLHDQQEYLAEYYNYFLVNDKLEKLYVFLYDPRFFIEGLTWHAFEIKREDIAYEIERMRDIDQIAENTIKAMCGLLLKKYGG